MPAVRYRLFPLACVLSGLLLCGCQKPPELPDAGFDYQMSGAPVLLGYPIPKTGEQTFCLSDSTAGSAFLYAPSEDCFSRLKTDTLSVTVNGQSRQLPFAQTPDGPVYFAFEADGLSAAEGAFGREAVLLCGTALYTADATGKTDLLCPCGQLLDLRPEKDGILYYDTGAQTLFDVSENGKLPLLTDTVCSEAWYVTGAVRRTVVFCAEDTWYYTEDGQPPIPCILPEPDEGQSLVCIADTAFVMCGDTDTAILSDLRTGKSLPMDMGGLYRFTQAPSVRLPLSPDGYHLFFSDIDFIYRLNLVSGQLALADNEALIFEDRCVISSMTAVTETLVLLSQASNEYTEYVPVLTFAVFAEDLPADAEEEKFDLAPDTESRESSD